MNYNIKLFKEVASKLAKESGTSFDKVVIMLHKQGYLGLDNLTLLEIGHIFSVSRERVRQIEKGAYSRLKHPCTGIRTKDLLVDMIVGTTGLKDYGKSIDSSGRYNE